MNGWRGEKENLHAHIFEDEVLYFHSQKLFLIKGKIICKQSKT